jgi:hypothetical protein
MVKKVTILLTILMLQIIPIVYASEPTTIYFTHTHEYYRDFYFVYDSISVEGANFESNRNYNITLVKDITLANNMVIPESSPGTTTMITSDSDGIVTTTEIWSQWNNTEIDDDGLYTEEIDVVDSTTIRPGRGITREGGSEIPAFHTPEFPGGSIMAILAFLMAALLFRSKKITSLPKIS